MRELAQPVRTERVEPAVAHVADGQPVTAHERQRDHAGHAPQFGRALGPLEDLVVGDGNGFAHALGGRAEGTAQPVQDHVARDRGRDFAGRGTADAVDHAVDAASGIDERQILVVVAHAAGVAPERGQERRRRERHARQSWSAMRARQASHAVVATSAARNTHPSQ